MGLAATLPDWVDADQMKSTAVVALVILVILVFVTLRVVQKMVTRVIMAGLLIAAGLFVYAQRDDLDECQKRIRAELTATSAEIKCTCDFMGVEVTVPNCPIASPLDD